jgi:hypothetical protein
MALTATEEGKATSEELAGAAAREPAAISGAVEYLARRVRPQHDDPGHAQAHLLAGRHPWYATSFTRMQLYAQIENSLRELDRPDAAGFASARPHRRGGRVLPVPAGPSAALLDEWYALRRKKDGSRAP